MFGTEESVSRTATPEVASPRKTQTSHDSILLSEELDSAAEASQIALIGAGIEPQIDGESNAQRRRRQRIALVQEFGGDDADMKAAVREAIRRGMYSPRTNVGDIESALMRTWKHRRRNYLR